MGNVVELLYVYVFYTLSKMVLSAAMAVIVYIIGKLDRPLKPPKEVGDMGKDLQEFVIELQKELDKVETIWGKIPKELPEEIVEMEDFPLMFILLGIVAMVSVIVILQSCLVCRAKREGNS